MSKLTAEPVLACAPLDAAKQAADGLCSALSGLACIVRSGAALPVGDGRERIARLLVRWGQDVLPDLESRLAALDTALATIQNDVIEARGGERFSLAWRKGESAFDVLRQVARDVIARFHNCPAAVEGGSRVFCEQLETAIQPTSDHLEVLHAGINTDFALTRRQNRQTTPNPTPQFPTTGTARTTPPKSNPRPKRSTERGEGRAKLIAALTRHHQHAEGGCLNADPIGNNELARAAGVSASTASAFFSEKFDGHTKYRALCRDAGKLSAALKLLNGEYAPSLLFCDKPPGEEDRGD